MSANNAFPSYQSRYLPALTPAQIAALPDKEFAPVILTTGAIEQHGPHLPVSVDAFLGQVWLSLALSRLPADASCYVAPPITIGKSNEHTDYSGTLIVSKSTLRELVMCVARQVKSWGFGSLAILNTHGGNISVLRYTQREVKETFGLRVCFLNGYERLGLSEQEDAYGFHAGELETSLMLAAVPELVHMRSASCEYPASLGDPGELRPEAAPATFSWATTDISRSGIMGDAPAASAEKGRRWLELGAASYAEQILEICREGRSRGR
jgi:creatinine amidohydrolase